MPTTKRPRTRLPEPPAASDAPDTFRAGGGYEELPWTDEDEAITARVFEELRVKRARSAPKQRANQRRSRPTRADRLSAR
jgi:hypothetical protein